MKKRILAIVLIAMMVFAVTACGNSGGDGGSAGSANPPAAGGSEAGDSGAPSGGDSGAPSGGDSAESGGDTGTIEQNGAGKTIGVAHFWLGNDWNLEVQNAYTEYLEARGYKINVSNAQNSTAQEKTDLENFIAAGVDGIIITGGEARAFGDISIKAKEAGIPIVCIDMILPGAVASVSADNYSGGAQLGLFVARELNGEGKVAMIVDPSWQSVGLRGEMIERVLSDYPGIEIVATQDVTDDPVNNGYQIVKSVLQAHPDLKAVTASWGIPSIGAAQAIQEMGLEDQVVIATADNDKAILEAMGAEGAPRWVTIGQDCKAMGLKAAQAIDGILSGQTGQEFVNYGPTFMTANVPLDEAFFEFNYVEMKDMWSIAFGDADNPF
ncbi:MAG: sugar ABC transporter substrate-binding protein [Clostridiales Family XIII bacterium]|jgi:ribose transport system substrate-binding protein|nr:sugar ABC transporter substrate-binding protein [Clostridiales Family XIII bacterium]